MSVSRAGVLAGCLLAVLTAGVVRTGAGSAALAPAAAAQNIGIRTVSGAVLDGDSQPVVGATVFLKDQKTKAIRSFTSVALGHFYFAQVNKSDDYDLWAEKNGRKTAVKTVSSWDARTQFVTDLKLK